MILESFEKLEHGTFTCVIGTVDAIQDKLALLICNDKTIKVLYQDLLSYKSKNVFVYGTVEDNYIKEVFSCSINDDFDFHSLKLLHEIQNKNKELY
ncbi:hypothetical protein EHP00_1253 [Ecytonucleospora hepatopenaei]|uniref:Uncharacterized protein n=1 Tax=Ecytonucleospora hepatopenaei TaxID=646526 RepID=A0A1W0E3F1_9MICR|nr:hypothetical protein EHP00_1253 [Ecytonucleospora hepatopenaei]